MSNLCKEAAIGPIRSISDIINVSADQVCARLSFNQRRVCIPARAMKDSIAKANFTRMPSRT